MVKNKKNTSGFTLVELLAVVAIIALLVAIAIFSVNRLFGSSREKATEVSEDAIKKSAVTYANENYLSDTYWVKSSMEDFEYACVPILELVNKGYLKDEDIDEHGKGWKFIKINRYVSNKTVFSEESGDGVCFFGTDGTKGTGIEPIKITTTSVEVQSYCIPNDDVKGISFALADNEFNDNIGTLNTDGKYVYKFSSLISGSTYAFKARCNYNDGVSAEEVVTDSLETGTMDYYFSLPVGDAIKLNNSVGELYKTIEVNFNSENVTEPSYYFRVSSSNTISKEEVMVCGNGTVPSIICNDYDNQVSGYSGVKLEKGYWYKLKDITFVNEDTDEYSDSVKLEVYNNSTIYMVVHDGDKFLDGKSTQMTFKSNPYVVLNISHSKYDDDFKGSFLGGDSEVPFYSDNWMSMPTISWQVYGGYNTKSYVYYSNSTDNYDSMGQYKTSNVVSGYNGKTNCNVSGKCYINADNFTKGGMQEIGIVVVNIATKKETVIRVQVNIDKKVPVITIVNDSGGNWTNKDVITTISYDDDHSGINPKTLSWKKGSGSYTTYTDNASNKSSRVDTWPATSTWAGEYTAYYKICDNADNCSTVTTPIKIDITKPTLVANLTANGSTYTTDTWTKYNVVRKLTTSDTGGSTVDKVQYQNDCTGSWSDLSSSYVSSYTYSTTGNLTNKMCLKVKDVAGNESDILTLIVKIDKVKPTKPTTMSFVHGGWYDYDGSWTNKTVYAARIDGKSDSSKRGPTGSSDTGGSGVVKYQISSDGSTWKDYSYSTSNSLYVMSTTGTYTRYFRAVDGVGNVSDALSVNAYVDKTAPTNLSIYNPKEGVWTNTSFKLTLTSSDAHSGIGYYQYTYSSSASSTGDDNTTEWVTYANSAKTSFTTTAFSAQRNQAVYIRVCDKVGNCSSKDSTMIMIDTTLPTPPTKAEIKDGKIVLTGSDDTGGSGWKNDRISFYGDCVPYNQDHGEYVRHYPDTKNGWGVPPISLSDFTLVGSCWYGTSSDDNAGNNSGSENGKQGYLTVAEKVTSSHYECSSGYVSGAYCINYYNVSSSTKCNSCSVYGGSCSVCIRYAECPDACKKSYYNANSCNQAGYVWAGTGSFCWGYGTYYKTVTSCDSCGSTTSYSCPYGWEYSSSGGYCWKWATLVDDTSCEEGYTEGTTELCYKLS